MTFDLKRLADVIRTNATVTTQSDFLATHTPFSNLRFVLSGLTEQSARKIDEETFYKNNVVDQREHHQFIVIQGDNGSGKSHFIRWIKERYAAQIDSDNEAVLLIIRDQNTLRGALEQIINADIFPPGMELSNLHKLVEANQHLSKEALKQNIAVQFAVAAQNAAEEDSVLDRKHRRKVYPFLTDQLVQNFLSQAGKVIDRIYHRLNPDESGTRKDDLEPRFLAQDLIVDRELLDKMQREEANKNAIRLAEDLYDSEKGPELRVKLAQFLNQQLEFVIQSCTNLRSADLKAVFEQLRISLKEIGKNLTLFIEDITSFTGIDRALVEVLVTENFGSTHNEKFCRLFSIVGVTNDYYQTSFPDNLKERVTGRVFIDRATLNNSDELAEMTARYLNAIALKPSELETWVNNGGNYETLPIAGTYLKHQWAIYTLPDGRELSIYPFNRQALLNMYDNLQNRTPRRFLQDVISHTIRMFANYDLGEFPPSVVEFEGEFKVPLMRDSLHENVVKRNSGQQGESVITLLRIWGDGSADRTDQDGIPRVGGLRKEVFEAFRLPFIEGVSKQETMSERMQPHTGHEQMSPDNPGKPIPPISPIPEPSTTPPPSPQLDKGQLEFKKVQEELEIWLSKEGKLNSFKDLRKDALDLLLEYIDWDAEGIPGPVVNSFLNVQRISIAGQTGLSYEGYEIGRSELAKNALLALAAWRHLGKKSWDFEHSTDHLVNLYNWLERVKEEVIATLRKPAGEENVKNWDLPRWGLLAHYYVQGFADRPLVKNTVDAVYDSLFQATPKIESQEHRSQEWKVLQVRLKQMEHDINENHDFLKKHYNRMQVSITGSTDVYFIDAVPLLQLIKELQQSGWNMQNVDTTLVKDKSDLLWYRSLKILSLLNERVNSATTSEVEHCRKSLEDLEKYTGSDIPNEEVQLLMKEMHDFLSNALQKAAEAYPDHKFKPFTDKVLTANKLIRARERLRKVTQTEGMELFLMLAAHPAQHMVPFIDLMKNMNELLDTKIQKFHNTLLNFDAQGITDVNKVIQQTTDQLNKLLDAYTKIHQGARM